MKRMKKFVMLALSFVMVLSLLTLLPRGEEGQLLAYGDNTKVVEDGASGEEKSGSNAIYEPCTKSIEQFIADSRFCNGAPYGDRSPYISKWPSKQCCAYCADYVAFCYDDLNWATGDKFTNVNDIRRGDVVLIGNGNDGNGHYFVVIGRDGDKLNVAEGNWQKKVRVGWNWKISGNTLTTTNGNYSRTFTCGWHYITAYGSPMNSGYDRVLPDGDYIIASTARMDDYGYYYLDIDGSGNAASETDVHVFYAPADNIPDCDVWNIKYSNGFYRIKQKGSNLDLDVAGASQVAGTNVRVWENNQQTWAISYNSNKTGYRIQSQLSGFSLNVSGNVDSGTNVNIDSNSDSENQSWVLIPYKPSQPIANGRYVLLSKLASGWTMDVAGNTGEDTQNGQNVQIWTDAEGISKWNSFDFTKLSNGYYKVTHAASGKALDVEGWKTNYGTNISLYQYTQGALNQQWAIKKTSTGYALINRNSGMALDVEGAKVGDGVNIIEYPYHGEKCQSWDFVKAEYKVTYNANGGSGAPAAQTKYYKHTLKLSSTKPTRSNYTFKGWATSSTATTATYQPGANLTTNANVTLYAVWQANKPAAPSGVKAVSASSTSVKVSWNAVSGVTGYQVWRATSANGTYTALGSVTTTNRTCTGLTAGTKYYFKVRAYKETNGTKTYGSFSSVVSAEPQLAAPGSVKISARATTSLTVSWNYVGGATGYEVYRATTSNGTYSKLGEVTETSRKCPGLTSGKKYYFKVRAFVTVNGTKHYGKYSSVISGVTLLSTPTVKIASSTSTSVTLSWNAVSGATGYEAYRATSANGTYSKMGDVFTTSRKCPGLTTGKTYYFKVRAFVEIDGVRYYGNYSTVVSKQVK